MTGTLDPMSLYASGGEFYWHEYDHDDEFYEPEFQTVSRLYRSEAVIVENTVGMFIIREFDDDFEVMTEWRRMLEDA